MIGGGICKLLVMLIGVAGTWVLAIALELILGILLTGVSIEAAFRKLCGALRKKSEQVHEYANTSVEMELEEDDASGSRLWRPPCRRGRRQPQPENISEHSRKKKESPFFDDYFSGARPFRTRRKSIQSRGLRMRTIRRSRPSAL